MNYLDDYMLEQVLKFITGFLKKVEPEKYPEEARALLAQLAYLNKGNEGIEKRLEKVAEVLRIPNE